MGAHSCSTFLLKDDRALLIGHNLDDYIEVPGLVVVNPRGVAKHNLSWDGLRVGPFVKEPRIEWVSRYGSVTYNPMGRELPDGGMNEAGLYVGEMTLFGTVFPADPALPKLYHQLWIQYLLDNFSTVGEVLDNLGKVLISGHCQWHFFIADRQGNCAVIEFLKGQAQVRRGADLPYPILCNRSYSRDLEEMGKYIPFGGQKELPFDSCEDDPRFAWAVTMLQEYPKAGKPPVEYAFDILKQLYCGNNKWSLVYDVKAARMYFQTYRARTVRYVDFNAFDFSPAAPAMLLDIHAPLEGDVAHSFVPYSETMNDAALRSFVANVNWGNFVLNKLWTKIFIGNIHNGIRLFKPAGSSE